MEPRVKMFETWGFFQQFYHHPLPESIFDKDVVARYFQAHQRKLISEGKSE